MKLFDIFDEHGGKLGEIHGSSDDGGCFGGCIGIIFVFFLLLGGGFFAWYTFFREGYYEEYLIQVVLTMLVVVLSSFLCIRISKKIIRSILLTILIGGITLGLLLVSSPTETFFSALIVGILISMFPSVFLVLLFKLLIYCFDKIKSKDDVDT